MKRKEKEKRRGGGSIGEEENGVRDKNLKIRTEDNGYHGRNLG
jgi:hypothetical protein